MNDLISRQAAIEAMSCINDSICEGQAIDALSELPTIDPVKHGKWYEMMDGRFGNQVVCRECGATFWEWMRQFRYCPNCGARMDG